MRKVVLDTNAYSHLMKGDEKVLHALEEADQVYLPIFVLVELFNGFKFGNREAENLKLLAEFEKMETVKRLFPTDETLKIFSELFYELRIAGTPIPVHDIWIAASAIETGSQILSYDSHFKQVKKARLWDF